MRYLKRVFHSPAYLSGNATLGIYRWSIIAALIAFSTVQLIEHFLLHGIPSLFRNIITVLIEVSLTAVIVVIALKALHDEQRRLMEIKNEFISHVSHELRTPLHSIQGFAELLQNDIQSSTHAHEQDQFAGIILQETRRLLILINDLLDISRIDAGRALEFHLMEVDLATLTRRAAMLLAYTTDRHHVTLNLPPRLAYCSS